MNNAIVDVRNVSITIDTFQGPLRVIRNQDISLQPGEILGIVGEWGWHHMGRLKLKRTNS